MRFDDLPPDVRRRIRAGAADVAASPTRRRDRRAVTEGRLPLACTTCGAVLDPGR